VSKRGFKEGGRRKTGVGKYLVKSIQYYLKKIMFLNKLWGDVRQGKYLHVDRMNRFKAPKKH
jgi:hypothetical protein